MGRRKAAPVEEPKQVERPVRRPSISPSQLEAMGCRFSWYLGYNQGYRAKRSSIPLEFGTAIHYGLEQYYARGDDPVAAFTGWMDKRIATIDENDGSTLNDFQEHRVLGIAMLTGYLEHHGDDRAKFKIIATEKTIGRPLLHPETQEDTGVDVVVRLDGLVRDLESGKVFSLEHKTFTQFKPEQMDIDHQFTAQVWVGQRLLNDLGINEPVFGVIYNGLRKQAPSNRVKNALFERHFLLRNQRQIDIFLHRAFWQWYELYAGEKLRIYPQPSIFKCGTCDFKEVCGAYCRGEDWQYLLDTMFTKRR